MLLVKMKAKYANISDWNCKTWIAWLATGGGSKKRFQYCVNPQSPGQFLYFRAIQVHSGENSIDPTLQDKVLLPTNFIEYICHVGNVSELHSITREALIPGGKKAS